MSVQHNLSKDGDELTISSSGSGWSPMPLSESRSFRHSDHKEI